MASGRVSRLTSEQIQEIRESFCEKCQARVPAKTLAAKHKIHTSYVGQLRRNPIRGKSVTK